MNELAPDVSLTGMCFSLIKYRNIELSRQSRFRFRSVVVYILLHLALPCVGYPHLTKLIRDCTFVSH